MKEDSPHFLSLCGNTLSLPMRMFSFSLIECVKLQRSRLQTMDVRNTCEGKTTTTQRILSRPGSVISSIKNFKNNKLTLAEGRVIMSDISVCNTNL